MSSLKKKDYGRGWRYKPYELTSLVHSFLINVPNTEHSFCLYFPAFAGGSIVYVMLGFIPFFAGTRDQTGAFEACPSIFHRFTKQDWSEIFYKCLSKNVLNTKVKHECIVNIVTDHLYVQFILQSLECLETSKLSKEMLILCWIYFLRNVALHNDIIRSSVE